MSTSATSFKESKGKVVDPVCGMTVDPESTKLFSTHRGYKYYFCAQGCLKSFGWFGRYLDRMAKINEKEFGSQGPSCCH